MQKKRVTANERPHEPGIPAKGKVMEQVKLAETQLWEDEATTRDGHARIRAKVAGVRCSLCTGIIERRLGRQPGVYNVSVSLPHEQVLIEYDRGRVGAEQVLGTLRDLGFTIGNSRAARRSREDTSALVSEGRRLLALAALSALTVPLMFLEMWNQVGGWVAWVLGAFAVLTFVLAPQLLMMTVESRHRGLLSQAPVVRASALGGLVGGLIGLLFRPEHYPTGGFFAVTVLVVAYYSFSRWLALLVARTARMRLRSCWSCSRTRCGLVARRSGG